MAKKSRIIDLPNGGTIAFIEGSEFYLTCCDCSLTHKFKVIKAESEVHIKITRDNRRTSQKRRRLRQEHSNGKED